MSTEKSPLMLPRRASELTSKTSPLFRHHRDLMGRSSGTYDRRPKTSSLFRPYRAGILAAHPFFFPEFARGINYRAP